MSSFIFLGWLLDAEVVKLHFPGISPTTAFTLALTGAALALRLWGKARRLAQVGAGVVFLIGALKLSEFLFGIDTGIDHLIVIESLAVQPKLLAPNTAINFVLIGGALLTFDSPFERRIKLGQLFTLTAALIVVLALSGHLYSLSILHEIVPGSSMSFTTAILFLLLCFSIMLTQRDQGYFVLLGSDTIGGATLRRLLPIAVAAPIILGGIRILAGRMGLFTPDVGVILYGASLMIVLLIVVYWNAQVTDRTDQERHRMEQALRESEARYRALFEHASDALVITDDQGHYIDANPQAELVTGYTRDELLRLGAGDLTPRREGTPTGRERHAVLRRDGVLSGETVIIRKDGREIEIEFTATRIAPGLHLSISRDITERRQAEQALRESEARYRAVFEYSSDAIFIFDERGYFIDLNPQAERLTGYDREELLALPPGTLAAPGNVQVRAGVLEQLRKGERVLNESAILRKDGSEVAVEFAAGGIAPGIYQSITHDISERKKVEENLRSALDRERELNELKSRFVSMVSHDFRTPLAVIQSSTDILLKYSDRLTADQQHERIEKIQLQVTRLVQMLENILIVGRGELVGIEFNSEQIDVGDFCASLISEFRLAAPTHTIVFNSSGDCTEMTADPKLLRQAITNLLSNAVKYSPEHQPVQVDLVCGETEIVMRVQDHGIGIPEEDQAHLFDFFHRAGNVGSISGTGIGMSIVKQAVDAHKGTIQLESAANIGTTFTISLPRLQDA